MSISIEAKNTDNPEFVMIVETMINALDDLYVPQEIHVLRIRGWFDHKWLNFSGKGRVRFDFPFPDHPQVALDPFFQEQTTFPPFTPNRILSQESWALDHQNHRVKFPHRLRHERTAKNLNRRVKDHSESAVYLWYSSDTDENNRGCVMVYHNRDGSVNAWYSSFSYVDAWRLDKTKGIDRDFLLQAINEPGTGRSRRRAGVVISLHHHNRS
jgi:hypothetical protein